MLRQNVAGVFVLCAFVSYLKIYAASVPLRRAANLNRPSTSVTKPTRILDSSKLHMDRAEQKNLENVQEMFQYKDKQKLKRKYVEWMYNAVLQQ